MSSPLLALGEGKRTIELVLGFSSDPVSFDVDKSRKLLAPDDASASVASFNPFQLSRRLDGIAVEAQRVLRDYPDTLSNANFKVRVVLADGGVLRDFSALGVPG